MGVDDAPAPSTPTHSAVRACCAVRERSSTDGGGDATRAAGSTSRSSGASVPTKRGTLSSSVDDRVSTGTTGTAARSRTAVAAVAAVGA
jgi:hypothetical protein